MKGLNMYELRSLPTVKVKWGVLDGAGRQLLLVELERDSGSGADGFGSPSNEGKDQLLATFMGHDAIERAFDWLGTVELPRLLRSCRTDSRTLGEWKADGTAQLA